MKKTEFYAIVASEIKKDKMDSACWAEAIEKGDGDIGRARGLYIKLRVRELRRLYRKEMRNKLGCVFKLRNEGKRGNFEDFFGFRSGVNPDS